MNINSIEDTTITAFLGGGRSGAYNLRIWRDQWGYSDVTANTDNFSYKIGVSSVSPVIGSMMG